MDNKKSIGTTITKEQIQNVINNLDTNISPLVIYDKYLGENFHYLKSKKLKPKEIPIHHFC